MFRITKIEDYKDLIGFLLMHVRRRPGLFLGGKKISYLPNFILGYEIRHSMTSNTENQTEKYFEEPGFINWFFSEHDIEQTSFWHTPFLEEANGDEEKALDLYFDYLEKYSKSI